MHRLSGAQSQQVEECKAGLSSHEASMAKGLRVVDESQLAKARVAPPADGPSLSISGPAFAYLS